MELWELVRLVSERYGKRLQRHLAASSAASRTEEVSVQQFQYLQAIRASASPTVSGLAAYFSVRSPTVTVAVQRLVERGLVRKRPDPADARRGQLTLTPKAHRLFAAQDRAFKALGEDIRAALDPADFRHYARLTEQVCRALERLDEDPDEEDV